MDDKSKVIHIGAFQSSKRDEMIKLQEEKARYNDSMDAVRLAMEQLNQGLGSRGTQLIPLEESIEMSVRASEAVSTGIMVALSRVLPHYVAEDKIPQFIVDIDKELANLTQEMLTADAKEGERDEDND